MNETPRHSVSVAAAIFDDSRENVLLIKRRDNGNWEPPGGVLELDETIEDGLRREVLEETGLSIEIGELSGVYKNMDKGIIALVFTAKALGRHDRSSAEASLIKWHPCDTLDRLMTEAYRVRITDARPVATAAKVRSHDGLQLLSPSKDRLPPDVSSAIASLSTGTLQHAVEIQSNLSRPGKPFTPVAELDVLPALRSAARKLGHKPNALTLELPESPLPVGVPDLTVLFADPYKLESRLRSDVPPILSEQEVRIVAACGPSRAQSIESLVRVTGVSERQTRRLIAGLVAKEALWATTRGWLRAAELEPLGRSYALEAKVSNWRSGVAQCLRYASYADAAGLALGDSSARVQAAAIEFAKRNHIGLFINDRWTVKPRMLKIPNSRRMWVSEHFVAAIRP